MDSELFIGIGAQKSGTTWLANYLTNHPEVGFSPIKELHFFSSMHRNGVSQFEKQFASRLRRKVSRMGTPPSATELEEIRCLTLRLEMQSEPKNYKLYFDLLQKPNHKVVGEITPAYSTMNHKQFLKMRELIPTVKILFIMRDPVDRLWSHLRFEETRGRDQGKFIAKERLNDCLKDPVFNLRTDYKRTLLELYKVFPDDRICILFFENLMDLNSSEEELSRLTNFLGIKYIAADTEKKVHVSKSISLTDHDAIQIAQEFSSVYRYIEERFGERMPERWRDRMALIPNG